MTKQYVGIDYFTDLENSFTSLSESLAASIEVNKQKLDTDSYTLVSIYIAMIVVQFITVPCIVMIVYRNLQYLRQFLKLLLVLSIFLNILLFIYAIVIDIRAAIIYDGC